MMPLKERAADAGVEHHRKLEVRVYEGDWAQGPRIEKARVMVTNVCTFHRGQDLDILELGCGTGDISGPFSEDHRVAGIDCNPTAIAEAERRFPRGRWGRSAIPSAPSPCGVLILCETLEHLEDPKKLVADWLPLAKHSVISHPLDEPMGCGLSNGDHQWSFTLDDFKGWFALGGHELVEHELFEMGAYKAVIGRGRRIAAD